MVTQKKTIAVTGASGLIGSHLLPVLLEEGYQLRVLSRRLHEYSPSIIQFQGDIRSVDAVCHLMRGCNTVIHLAGVAHTSLRSQADMDEAFQINVGGTRNVLDAAQKAGVERVLLVSSAHVYANQEGTDLDEQSPTAGDSFYARSKLMVEQAGLEAANSNRMAVVIVRPCLTYGPGVRFNLESLMRAVQGHYYFHIRGKNPVRSLLSVGNAAAAIMYLSQVGVNGRIYNLADEDPLPLVEFIDSLADLMKVHRPRNVPMLAIRAAIAGAEPLRWMGLRSPINRESLHKLTVSFSLDVKALAASGFRWLDDGLITRKRMVEAYLASR
jgi:nucleoside-diphosphate-sugar epimerase